MELELIPEIPSDIIEAAKREKLVLFVGSGLSMRMGASNWETFADKVLNQLVENGLIDHNSKDQIKHLSPRKKLSIANIIADSSKHPIDYKSSIVPKKDNECKVYDFINQIECKIITTNYDEYLHQEPKNLLYESGKGNGISKSQVVRKKIITDRKEISRHLLDKDNLVIHLHGCFKGSSSKDLIITTEDYLDLYSDSIIEDFLEELFSTEKYTILFLGYGLEEMEILEHLLRKGRAQKSKEEYKRFWLEGFFSHQEKIIRYLDEYYRESFGVKVIPYNRDKKNFQQIDDIIEDWAYKIQSPKFKSTTQFQILKDTLNDE